MLIVIDNDFNRSNYRSLIGRTYFHIPPAYAQVCELEYTPEQLAAAREWLADLTFADVDPDEFASMSADKVIDGVARKYAGGWYEFVKSCEPMPMIDHSRANNVLRDTWEAIHVEDCRNGQSCGWWIVPKGVRPPYPFHHVRNVRTYHEHVATI